MSDRPSHRVPGLIEIAIFGSIAGVIWLGLYWTGFKFVGDPTVVSWITGAVVLALWSAKLFTGYAFQMYIARKERAWKQEAERSSTSQRAVSDQLGIERVYKTLREAAPDILRELERAKEIRLFLQVGRYMLGGDHTFVYDALKKRDRKDLYVRVLHASKDSPFLSEDRLRTRRSNIRAVQAGLENVLLQVRALRDEGIRLESRQHQEPYLWRLLFFDEVAYVSGYFFEKDNDEHAVVYRIVKGDKSLYQIFERYFEYLWEHYPPGSGTLQEIIPSSAESGAALLVRREGRFVLMVFDRSKTVDNRPMYRFAGIGGKRTNNETWLQCAMREGREETGCTVSIVSALESCYLDLLKRVGPINISDEPRPAAVIETPDEGTGFRAGWGKRYTTVYLASLEGELHLQSEIRGFLFVSGELLLRMYRESLTFKAFKDAGGEYKGDNPPNDAILRPYGAAELLALTLESGKDLLAPLGL